MNLFRILLLVLATTQAVLAKPLVVTTHTVLADFAREIGGDTFEVTCLLPVSTDPHNYDPRPADVRSVARAALVIQNGLGLEPWAGKLLGGSGYRGPVVEAATGLPDLLRVDEADADHAHEHEGEFDPHAWHDARLAQFYVRRIASALTQVAPGEAKAIQARLQTYLGKLAELDRDAQERFAQMPASRRKLVTSHSSLAYFGRAYGLTVIPVAGARPDQEPSARELAGIVTLIRKERIPAVFFESTTSPKLIETLAKEAGVDVVQELYTDSLGAPGSAGETYVGMFRHNVTTVLRSLR